jgi:hypothetical protein
MRPLTKVSCMLRWGQGLGPTQRDRNYLLALGSVLEIEEIINNAENAVTTGLGNSY